MLANLFGKPTQQNYEVLNNEVAKMKPYEVPPPPQFVFNAMTGVRPHQCFKAAQAFIKSNLYAPLPMVYVYCFWSEIPFIDHAFVLINEQTVYDGVLNKFYYKDDYYREMQIVEIRRKTPPQVIKEHANSFDISQDDWTARLKHM